MSNIKQEPQDEMQLMLGNCLVLLEGNRDQEIPEPALGANMLDEATCGLISNLRWNLKDPKQNNYLANLVQDLGANRANRYPSRGDSATGKVKISGPIVVAVPLDGAKENYQPAFILVVDYLTYTQTAGVTIPPEKAHPCKKHLCAVAVPPLRCAKKGVSEFNERGSVAFYQIPSPLYLDNMVPPRKSSDGKIILVKNSAVKNTKWLIQVEDEDAPTWMPLPKFLGLKASCKTSEIYERFILKEEMAEIRGQVAINVSLEYSFSPNRRDQKVAEPADDLEEDCGVKRSRARSRSPKRSSKKSKSKSDKKTDPGRNPGRKHKKESSKAKHQRAKLLAKVVAAEKRIALLSAQVEAN
jgi:hypothetical protein